MSADPTRPPIASPASTQPRWRFLIGWWLGSERSGNNVFLGPNPSRFHPPSLRPEAPIGQAPPVFPFLLIDSGQTGPDHAVAPKSRPPPVGRVARGERTATGAERQDPPGWSCGNRRCSALCQNRLVEITWYGGTCVRLRGRDAVVVADA